eukprot:m.235084 g.235084  ORF g.235084 m.235084 type:complete len:457 (-) comp19331_c0_seq3:1672-3042(-)
MHCRNRYKDIKHDFGALAEKYPEVRPYMRSKSSYNFRAPGGVAALTKALLLQDFNLEVSIPDARLAPPIPQKLNYIHWIEDLLSIPLESIPVKKADGPTTSDTCKQLPATSATGVPDGDGNQCSSPFSQHRKSEKPPAVAGGKDVSASETEIVRGIDIGTGCICIYPLLATSLHPTWTFAATELSQVGYESATRNVERNGLSNRIKVLKTPTADTILLRTIDWGAGQQHPAALSHQTDAVVGAASDSVGAADVAPPDKHVSDCDGCVSTHDAGVRPREPRVAYDFCMCNPPFFNIGESPQNRTGRRHMLSGPKAGDDVEMETVGGECGFVGRLVLESLDLGDRVTWYTSMLGKKSSLAKLKKLLVAAQVPTVLMSSLVQGRTHRWVIAWSYRRLPAARSRTALPPNTTVVVARGEHESHPVDVAACKRSVRGILDVLCAEQVGDAPTKRAFSEMDE